MSILSKINYEPVIKAPKILFYATEGFGKTSSSQFFPSPLLFQVESGIGQIAMANIKEEDLRTFEDVISAIDALINEEHNFKTVVIDSLTELQKKIYTSVCVANKVGSITDLGYGTGYDQGATKFGIFLNKLEKLHAKKDIIILLLAHTAIKDQNRPDRTETFKTYVSALQVNDRGTGIGDMTNRWVDNILFGNTEPVLVEKNGKTKAVNEKRMIYTNRAASHVAKNRIGLPEEIEYSSPSVLWPIIEECVMKGAKNE